MNDQHRHKNFIFNPKIDSGFLFSLYENDYVYILEVFTDSTEELENALMTFAMAYNAGDVQDLKNAAHKIKPLFGFTGLLKVQDAVKGFEDHCGKVTRVELLSGEYNALLEEINGARQILIAEQKRLQEFSGK